VCARCPWRTHTDAPATHNHSPPPAAPDSRKRPCAAHRACGARQNSRATTNAVRVRPLAYALCPGRGTARGMALSGHRRWPTRRTADYSVRTRPLPVRGLRRSSCSTPCYKCSKIPTRVCTCGAAPAVTAVAPGSAAASLDPDKVAASVTTAGAVSAASSSRSASS